MDIELVLDVLNKHNIDNEQLAEDLVTLANESYKDGAFDRDFWWYDEESYLDFVKDHGGEFSDELYNHIPGLPFDRDKK